MFALDINIKQNPGAEDAIIVALFMHNETEDLIQARINELKELIYTAGGNVVDVFIQKRNKPDPATFVGKGKIAEIKQMVEANQLEIVVFENELTPMQMQNIEEELEVKVLDRTAIILDVFSQRALSKEGKLQVELAQMEYILPRLIGYGVKLSRLGGGIGTRGPGETKLEVDRRRIRKRISDLNKEISNIRKHRELHRQRRKREGSFVVSLVGYTNAGKSSLMNALSRGEVITEDKLFATLDPTTRKMDVKQDSKNPVLLTDTVGFIRNLPSQVKTAFQATLEEITEADLLLHVVDVTHPEYERQIEIVRNMLQDLNIDLDREIIVFNKADLLEPGSVNLSHLERNYPGSVLVSAALGTGTDKLISLIKNKSGNQMQIATFYPPYHDGNFWSGLYDKGGEVMEMNEYGELHYRVKARVSSDFVKKYFDYTRLPVVSD